MTDRAMAVIFDMDGTLYRFPNNTVFAGSPFGRAVQWNVRQFIANEFGLNPQETSKRYAELKTKFNGEMSLGLERDFGIDRMRIFAETWNLDPAEFIVFEEGLRSALESVDARLILLTAAPRLWTDRVLNYMGIADLFGNRIVTGEPDIRKPDSRIFGQVVAAYDLDPAAVVSIGDQDYSDIVPARSLGMATVRIGGGDTVADIQADTVVEAIMKLRERSMI